MAEPTPLETATPSEQDSTVPDPSAEETSPTSDPAATTTVTTAPSSAADVAAGRWRPWHTTRARSNEPVDAVNQFVDFVGFGDGVGLGEYQRIDARSGEMAVDPPPTGDSTNEPSTMAFVRLDSNDEWRVLGAASPGVVVDAPADGAAVSSPLDVRVVHLVPSLGVRVQLWPDGASEPIVDEVVTSGSGAFTLGPWDPVLTWPPEYIGGATLVVTSEGLLGAEATTTVRVEMVAEGAESPPPDVPTVTGAIGDQRQGILYQPGVRLSVYEPDTCGNGPRPTLVTGGPSSTVFVEEFTDRGYVVVDVDWRTPGYSGSLDSGTLRAFSFSVHDLGAAVQWLRAHTDELCVDTDRIAAVGYSFGAITALSLAYTRGEMSAGDQVDVDELGGEGELADRPTPVPELDPYSDDVGAVVSFAGFALGDTIDEGEPPALLFHGRNDGTIPFALAEQTCAAADEVGVTCRLEPHDAGHGMAADVPAALDRADDFLRRQLQIGS